MADDPGPMAQGVVRQNALGDHIVQAAHAVVAVIGGHEVPLLSVPVRLTKVGPRTGASRLLRATSGVVPFVDRRGALAGLRAWVSADGQFGVQVIGGAGGTGKTRLAVELCHHVVAGAESQPERSRWLAGFLSREASREAMLGLSRLPVPRLIVVDYAETRREQVGFLLEIVGLQRLASAGASGPSGSPTRC